MNKAIFLDRDGVVNELVYFPERSRFIAPFKAEQFKILPGAPQGIRKFQSKGYKIIITSNQPGIAKGQMTSQDFEEILSTMRKQLSADGITLDGEYYCLHHPEATVEQYKAVCDCRKPKPGLILQAAKDLDIDISQSWMIGDNLTDIQAGKSAGCHTLLLGRLKCELCNLMDEENARPDSIKPNLIEAADYIIDK